YFWSFCVMGEFIMSGSARKITALWMLIANDSPVRDEITIDIPIASPFPIVPGNHFFEIFFPQDFSPIYWFIRVFKFLVHSLNHAMIQDHQHEYRHMQSFSKIKCIPTKFKTFIDRTWEHDQELSISMTHEIGKG